jgi:hypothetical protein
MAGGGIGEAMLISAATGAGTSAITGGDPLKGALMGAALGGAGAAVGGGASAAGGAGAAAPQSTVAVGDAATQASNLAGTVPITSSTPATIGIPDAMGTFNPMAEQSTVGLSEFYKGPQLTDTAGQIAGGAPISGQGATTPPTALEAFYAKNPIAVPAGLGALGSAIGAGPDTSLPGQEEYDGPLSQFRYDPRRYRAAASGGLMDTEPARRMAAGGLGSYSDGGQTLKGPGDGMSDSIPASIGDKQPARLADGEFVIPADVVSGLGNGSTDAGARQLYELMDKVRAARTGRTKQAPEINPRKMMPA